MFSIATLTLLLAQYVVASPALLNPRKSTTHFEIWTIPRLDMHILSPQTNAPGNPPWSDPPPFQSSIDLDVTLPHHVLDGPHYSDPVTVNCKTEFPNGTFPGSQDRLYCDPPSSEEVLEFSLKALTREHRRPEMAFELVLTSIYGLDENGYAQAIWSGSVGVTANDPGKPTGYLKSVGGAPWDGLRCGLKGGMSKKEDLRVDVARADREECGFTGEG
ncbi:hypothetical protein CC86DRAFT_453357 [Ophiobolus disseminans]|uniref:Ubiquitin 3 binding protein But2 C-terminal domain-containing protein n=1 Tax=Ophiobolus disseminans TaxID=1469910 RepID=A0A6A7AAT2_9PLEO|nr:hypothetical protein CC86DRAFT_453357 [Ophiobolus disseminans]